MISSDIPIEKLNQIPYNPAPRAKGIKNLHSPKPNSYPPSLLTELRRITSPSYLRQAAGYSAKGNKVGKTIAGRLNSLGILTAVDLLNYYPFRYDDFSQLKKIKDLTIGETTTIKGKIELLANKRSPRKRMIITECFLADETGSIRVVWFNQPFITKTLTNGDEVYLAGKIEGDLFNLAITSPSYEKAGVDTTHTARLVPIYPLTQGLTQKQLRFLIKQVLPLADQLTDYWPTDFLVKHHLPDLKFSLINIHFPKDNQTLARAQNRLKLDELIKLQLQNWQIKEDAEKYQAQAIAFDQTKTQNIVSRLGFKLTDAQKKCAWAILQDMAKPAPMNRLLEGDVGSGKTVVAAIAAANAHSSKIQSALLAPTDILASQHFKTLAEILNQIDLNLALLTRTKHEVVNTVDQKISKISKEKLERSLAIGEIDLVIGTHALLNEQVIFKNLGLVIIDEQHRFGVKQRQQMRAKSGDPKVMPHLLSMTATPIPRTLALTVYGDLDISVINQLPEGRKKPITKLVDPKNRSKAYDFILAKIKEGRQAYVICPLIEESDSLGVKSATEEFNKIKDEVFPQLKVGLMHGKLKAKDKDEVMAQFAAGVIDILVATSVVEVGVNVPNATIMIIESAERFGLSQLHQFRGRVNRAQHQSYCFLFTDSDSEKSLARLNALVDCYDGFKLAEIDLAERGFGSLFGIQQSGWYSALKIASLTDVNLIEQSKLLAKELIDKYPEVIKKMELVQQFHPE